VDKFSDLSPDLSQLISLSSIIIAALFECVEENQYEQLKSILEQKQLNVNALNNDGFSVLDLAVLLNCRQITKLLLQHGAQTGNFPTDNLESHLNSLLAESENKLSQINASIGQISEADKNSIERRIKLIRKMINGWQRLRVPDPPFSFTIGMQKDFSRYKRLP
jgi:ankyrin repeat protein